MAARLLAVDLGVNVDVGDRVVGMLVLAELDQTVDCDSGQSGRRRGRLGVVWIDRVLSGHGLYADRDCCPELDGRGRHGGRFGDRIDHR